MSDQNKGEDEVTIANQKHEKLDENHESEKINHQNGDHQLENKSNDLKKHVADDQIQENESITESEENKIDSKKSISSILAEHINEPEFESLFNQHWHSKTPCKIDNLEIIAEPFRVCKISNFIADDEFLKQLKNELVNINTARATMDLYQFEQTDDFKYINGEHVQKLRSTFQNDLANWMKKNTKIELNKNISMSSSIYYDGDYLLCHDDNNEDRRIAFILYLTKDWKEEDGGELALFDTDEDGLPGKIVKRIVPEYNSLIFFEVTHNSYHQVLEVLTSEKCRRSINGWFHGPIKTLIKRPERPKLKLNFEPVTSDPTFAYFWVRRDYLDRQVAGEINRSFESKSYEFLTSFLVRDKFLALSKEMQSDSIRWERVGPPDIRNYEVADKDSLPPVLDNFVKFLKSRKFLVLLNWYTDLDLIPSETTKPRMTVELQRWSSGCYTLINDDKSYEANEEEEEEECDNEEDLSKLYDDRLFSESSSDEIDENQPSCSYSSKFKKQTHDNSDVFNSDSNSSQNVNNLGEEVSSPPIDEETQEPGRSNNKRKLSHKKNQKYSNAKRKKKGESSEKKGEDNKDSEEKDEEEEEDNKDSKEKNEEENDSKEDEEYEEEEEETEISSDYLRDTEDQLRNYQTCLYMIENKIIVIPFKDQFRSMAENKSHLYNALYDIYFRIQEVLYPRGDRQKLVAIGRDAIRESWNALEIAQKIERAQLDQRVDEILKCYKLLEEQKSLDLGYAIEYEYPTFRKKEPDSVPQNGALPRCGLEVMLQFNARPIDERQYAYYVDPREHVSNEATLIRVPLRDNYLCMVYRERDVCRVQKYVNHYTSGTFYNLVCNYWESGSVERNNLPAARGLLMSN